MARDTIKQEIVTVDRSRFLKVTFHQPPSPYFTAGVIFPIKALQDYMDKSAKESEIMRHWRSGKTETQEIILDHPGYHYEAGEPPAPVIIPGSLTKADILKIGTVRGGNTLSGWNFGCKGKTATVSCDPVTVICGGWGH